jgi:acetyl-CoA C-acetyltransferase
MVHDMIRTGKKLGCASLCLGGGEAVALIVRRES